ncbi:A disintegrin and metalloproteinase with thrombospondin motifs 2 isoform X3, partial [Tachysurus ichikawai]
GMSDFNKHGNFLIQWLSRHDPKYPVQRFSSKASLSSQAMPLFSLSSLGWNVALSLSFALLGKLP